MDRPDRLVRIGNPLAQAANELAIQLWHRVAYGVRYIDGGGAFLDHRFNDTAQKIGLAAVAVFSAELNVIDQIARKTYRQLGLLKHLIGRHAQLLLHVQRRSSNKSVNACPVGASQRLGCAGDVPVIGARE